MAHVFRLPRLLILKHIYEGIRAAKEVAAPTRRMGRTGIVVGDDAIGGLNEVMGHESGAVKVAMDSIEGLPDHRHRVAIVLIPSIHPPHRVKDDEINGFFLRLLFNLSKDSAEAIGGAQSSILYPIMIKGEAEIFGEEAKIVILLPSSFKHDL